MLRFLTYIVSLISKLILGMLSSNEWLIFKGVSAFEQIESFYFKEVRSVCEQGKALQKFLRQKRSSRHNHYP